MRAHRARRQRRPPRRGRLGGLHPHPPVRCRHGAAGHPGGDEGRRRRGRGQRRRRRLTHKKLRDAAANPLPCAMRRGFTAATLITSIALTVPASAGEPTDMLRTLVERANRILSASDVTDDARLTALRLVVRDAFDAREAAALLLGREWMARSAAERDEFSRLYGDLIEGAYLGGVGSRARVHADGIQVAFDSELVQGTSATVRTTLETRGGGAAPVEY